MKKQLVAEAIRRRLSNMRMIHFSIWLFLCLLCLPLTFASDRIKEDKIIDKMIDLCYYPLSDIVIKHSVPQRGQL